MAGFDFSAHKKRDWTYYAAYLKWFKKNPKTIFEMGSGIGLFLEACRMNNIEAIGCELEKEGIAITKNRGLQIYKHDLANPLAFVESNAFDAVFCNQVIEHVNSAAQENIVREAYRILKPGGEFLVQSPCRHYEVARKDKYHINLLTPSELKALLEKHGFAKCNMDFNRPQEISEIPKDVLVSIWRNYHPDLLSQTATVLAEKPDYLKEPNEQQQLNKAPAAELPTMKEINRLRVELTTTRAELAKEKRTLQAVRDSFSFQMGQALVWPVRKPGRVVIRLSYRLVKKSPDGLKKIMHKVTNKSKVLTSLNSKEC